MEPSIGRSEAACAGDGRPAREHRRLSGASLSAPRHACPVRLRPVPGATRPFAEMREHIDDSAWRRLEAAQEAAAVALAGRTVWAFNSTAVGGGVAEMLRTLWPYWRGAGVDARWSVLEAPREFFRLTKRLHTMLHGVEGRRPSARDREIYAAVSRAAAQQAVEVVRPGDLVMLQDPQVAGLAGPLKRAGATVVWRCHIGADRLTESAQAAWELLLPYLVDVDAVVFTRLPFVPPGLAGHRVRLIVPAIDPCSSRNRPLPAPLGAAILHRTGLARDTGAGRSAGTLGVRRRARVLREGPAPLLGDEPLVVALARWDRLKDPEGIIRAFAEHVSHPTARLIIAGAADDAVADDPDARRVLRDVRAAWRALPHRQRRRIDVAELPMADVDENGLIVNALQRHAAVIVKKSIQEGFGLGVTEALWKARPVVATAVGGQRDQIEHGRTGLLVDDPADLAGFAAATDELLANRPWAHALGRAGREHARERLLGDRHFIDWMDVLTELAPAASGTRVGTGDLRPA